MPKINGVLITSIVGATIIHASCGVKKAGELKK